MGYVLLHNPYTIFDMYDLLTIASIICLAVSTRFTNTKYIYTLLYQKITRASVTAYSMHCFEKMNVLNIWYDSVKYKTIK